MRPENVHGYLLWLSSRSQQTFQTNETCEALKKCYLMRNIPKRNLTSGCHLLKKQLINLHGGQLDVTTNIYPKSCAYHPDSGCCTFFHGNLRNPKSSEDTLLYLYVIWNMLKSADLHETILTPVICHKHVRYHDGVTLYFFVKFPSVAPKKTRNGYFFIYVSRFTLSEVKTTKKKRGNFDWKLVNTENLRV